VGPSFLNGGKECQKSKQTVAQPKGLRPRVQEELLETDLFQIIFSQKKVRKEKENLESLRWCIQQMQNRCAGLSLTSKREIKRL